ncbi:hypothetical protein [Myroides injenensis]|uniref:hypothetical protein n=1 Tax=Myroides injenensis TaxID=1183151 RepID=UPI0002880647|nr:hypothetical protein [Myroides injenensis]
MGAISRAISFGIGQATISLGNIVAQSFMHGVTSGLMSSIDGGSFSLGFANEAIRSLISSSIVSLGKIWHYLDEDYTLWSSFASRKPGIFKAAMIVNGGFLEVFHHL